jgi:hypothetical protein
LQIVFHHPFLDGLSASIPEDALELWFVLGHRLDVVAFNLVLVRAEISDGHLVIGMNWLVDVRVFHLY